MHIHAHVLVLSLRSQRSDWLELVWQGLLKHGLCIPVLRQGPAAHMREREREKEREREGGSFCREGIMQFPPPPIHSLLVLHKLCRKSSRNLNLLLRYTTPPTGLCFLCVCCIFFCSSLSSLFFLSHVVKEGPMSLENGTGKLTAAQCWSRFSAWQALKTIPLMDEVGGAGRGGG